MLNNSATLQYFALSDTSYSRSAQLISLTDVREVQENVILKFFLPDAPGDTLIAEAALIKDHPETGFSWSGNLISGGHGYAIFRIKDHRQSAFISVDGRQYEIVALTDNIQALVKKNQDFSLVNNCGVQLPQDITFEENCAYTPDYNDCHALIDILIVVDPEAADEIEQTHGTVDAYLAFADLIINLAFWNSDIPNKEVAVKWIEMGGFNYSPPSDPLGIFKDADEFALFAENSNLRSLHNVDVVFLLTIERYPSFGGAVNEIGPNINAAFGIVETSSFYTIHAFAHEVGHIFGCRHQWGSDDTDVCAHGHFQVNLFPPFPGQTEGSGTIWRTLLATPLSVQNPVYVDPQGITYVLDNQGAILHYSNPDIDYAGTPTGNILPKTENNAQQIRNAGCIVSSFLPSSVLDVEITKSISCQSATFSAEAIPPGVNSLGQPPYYYTWHWSPDGVFGLNVLINNKFGTTQTATITSTPVCPVYWARCTVSSSDSIFITRIFQVNLSNYHCDCSLEIPPDEHSVTVVSEDERIQIRPNPAGDYIQLFADKFPEKVNYDIIDSWGRVIRKGTFTSDKNRYSIPVADFSPGVYRIHLNSAERSSVLSFIKQ